MEHKLTYPKWESRGRMNGLTAFAAAPSRAVRLNARQPMPGATGASLVSGTRVGRMLQLTGPSVAAFLPGPRS